MDRLSKVLPKVLARQKHAALLSEFRVRQAFKEVLGESLAGACESVELNGTSVTITTANPALAHQLRLDSETLIARLNAVTRLSRPIRTLHVRVGQGRSTWRRGGGWPERE
jgi:hypothetical protein